MTFRWYSVSVLSNYEKKVMASIQESVASNGLEDEIDQVLVPTEEVLEIKEGQKKRTERKYFPGYVMIKMDLSPVSILILKQLPFLVTKVAMTILSLTILVKQMQMIQPAPD